MNFAEALEKYKNGTASDAEKAIIEEELQKQEAINDYLFDRLDAALESGPSLEHAPAEENEEKFTKIVQKSVLRAFVKLGIVVGAFLLAVVLFLQFAAPSIANAFYYDPSEPFLEVTGSHTMPEYRFGLDMDVYTALRMPQVEVSSSTVASRGWGVHDVTLVVPDYSLETGPGLAPYYGGQVQRGKLVMYDPGLLHHVGSLFNATNIEGELKPMPEYFYTEMDYIRPEEQVAALPDGSARYRTFISFDEDKTLAEAAEFIDSIGTATWWLAVRVQDDPASKLAEESIGAMGLRVDNHGFLIKFLQHQLPEYPLLRRDKRGTDQPGGREANTLYTDEATLTEGMRQTLQYLQTQPRFLAMMGEDGQDLAAAEAYITENGLSIHGCFVWADKAMLEKIVGTPGLVYSTLEYVVHNMSLQIG